MVNDGRSGVTLPWAPGPSSCSAAAAKLQLVEFDSFLVKNGSTHVSITRARKARNSGVKLSN